MGFMVIVAVVISLLHIVGHILQRQMWGERYRKLQRWMLVVNMSSIFGLGVCWGRNYTGPMAELVLQAIAIWLMLQIFSIGLLAIALLIRYIYGRCRQVPVDESRRKFAKGALVLPCIAAGASFYGSLVERNETVLRSYDVPIEKLGKKLEGFSIAQLSDIHLGPFFDLDMLQAVGAYSKAAGRCSGYNRRFV